MAVIPFYGAAEPEIFAIERAAMDRAGRVIDRLDELLPRGAIADIGAGDGFTAQRLERPDRQVIPVEPAAGMVRPDRDLPWVRADAEHLPFSDSVLDGVYSTWAYFFSRRWDPTPGLAELHRVVVPGGPLIVVDNAGGDEFSAMALEDISADPTFWRARGFRHEIIETSFEFESPDDARRLLEFFFGEGGPERARTEVSFNVSLFVGTSRGAGTLPA